MIGHLLLLQDLLEDKEAEDTKALGTETLSDDGFDGGFAEELSRVTKVWEADHQGRSHDMRGRVTSIITYIIGTVTCPPVPKY